MKTNMSFCAFMIVTLYKTFLYIVGLVSGVAVAIWLKSRL